MIRKLMLSKSQHFKQMKKSRLMVVIRHTICTGIASNLHFREHIPPIEQTKGKL